MIQKEDTLFFRVHVGEASEGKGKNKRTFEMSINAHDSTPIIRLPDGRWWTLSWREMLTMAEEEAAAAPAKIKSERIKPVRKLKPRKES